MPASLRVYRYRAGASEVQAIIGEIDPGAPHDELVAHADEALTRATFMCYAVSQPGDFFADELCFVPQGDHCDILSIHTKGWQRHHGDHRRSLVEILNDLAAAVACGKLRILDSDELVDEVGAGRLVLSSVIADSATLSEAREAVDGVLRSAGIGADARRQAILCISEAVTNMLLHGGGRGRMSLRRLDDRLRVIVADDGPGLNFLNWIQPPSSGGQASMGYGLKIILEHLDAVGLHTGRTGTTLVLDRKTD
ncbi:MAG: ATP-binding protein [Thermoleophilia bacterium]